MQDNQKEKSASTDERIQPPSVCPQCNKPLERSMFRTGSTQHPGRDMLVCKHCGTKK